MPDVKDKLLALTRQLYPSGRAFKLPADGHAEGLHKALIVDQNQVYNDAVSIKYAILPDNANFTADDATEWETRLGLITNPLVSLSDRKLAIQRKLNYPTGNKTKQHYLHLQSQLQAAGFNVYVFENRFPLYPTGYYTQTPIDLTGDPSLLTKIQHGQIQHGQAQHGNWYNNKCVNHIDEDLDLMFDIGNNFRSTFFIGGDPVGSYANVDVNRKQEFRQLILRIKPVQTVAFLFINYV